MAHRSRARALTRPLVRPTPPAHPLARPASIPWAAVIILILTIGVGHWTAIEVLTLVALLTGTATILRHQETAPR